MSDPVRDGLVKHHDPILVDELLAAYADAMQSYYAGGLRLAEVEGGRFCEAVFRILEERVGGSYTALGRPLDTERLINRLAGIPAADQPPSVRLHIPRSLRVVYDVRNNRDAAHLADGIDPNRQDASLVAAAISWVLAELVRLYHDVPADEAQAIVDDLVTRRAPVVQLFGGELKVLNPALSAGEHCLVLLYQCGARGASYGELQGWVKASMVANLGRTLGRLVDEVLYVHFDGERYFITETGTRHVDERHLVVPV